MTKQIKIKKAADKPEATHDTGDTVEFAVTHHVKANNGRESWLRGGTTVTVRPDETGDQAMERAADFVVRHIDEAVDSIN